MMNNKQSKTGMEFQQHRHDSIDPYQQETTPPPHLNRSRKSLSEQWKHDDVSNFRPYNHSPIDVRRPPLDRAQLANKMQVRKMRDSNGDSIYAINSPQPEFGAIAEA